MKVLSRDEFFALGKKAQKPIKSYHVGFSYLNKWLAEEAENLPHGVNLEPDFQRGHVWSEQLQSKYIENVLRDLVDASGLTIRFNVPSWSHAPSEDSDLLNQMVCLDGLQRLSAIKKFINGELKVFGLDPKQIPLKDILRDLKLVVVIYDFQYKHELLQCYLDLNEGAVAHTASELARVREMLNELKGIPQLKTDFIDHADSAYLEVVAEVEDSDEERYLIQGTKADFQEGELFGAAYFALSNSYNTSDITINSVQFCSLEDAVKLRKTLQASFILNIQDYIGL